MAENSDNKTSITTLFIHLYLGIFVLFSNYPLYRRMYGI